MHSSLDLYFTTNLLQIYRYLALNHGEFGFHPPCLVVEKVIENDKKNKGKTKIQIQSNQMIQKDIRDLKRMSLTSKNHLFTL